MSGTQHPRQHGSLANNDALHSPASALPETLRALMRHSPDPSRSHVEEALPALYTPSPGSSTGVQNLPPLAATINWPPLAPVPISDMRRTQQPSANPLDESDDRRYSPLSHREHIETRASPDQVWPISQRDDVPRPTAARSNTHPQVPSTSAPSSSSRTVHQPPAYLQLPHPGFVPVRSHSTDYYTDSSNASAASSGGGHPPQSTASSGSSHTSVRPEDWARTYTRTRAGALPSVSHDPPSREGYASSSRPSLSRRQESPSASEETEVGERGYIRGYKWSATRGTARSPIMQEGREGGLTRRQSRHTSISSASTSARDRSSSPVSAGLRTPSAAHPVSDQRSEQLRRPLQPHHRSNLAAAELERVPPPNRSPSGEIRDTGEISQARSRSGGSASAAYFDASDFAVSTTATEESAGELHNAQSAGEYEASGPGSRTLKHKTSLPWYEKRQAGGPPQDQASDYAVRGTSSGVARSESASPDYSPEYEGHYHSRMLAHRSVTSPVSYVPRSRAQLRGPGVPGSDAFDVSLPAPAPRDYAPEGHTADGPLPRPRLRSRHATQPALSAPTPGYASNPAASFEERVARRYPGAPAHAHAHSQPAPPREREGRHAEQHGAGARGPASQDERRVPAQPESSAAAEQPPAPYSSAPTDAHAHARARAQPRHTAPIPIPVPTSTSTPAPAPHSGIAAGRPSPVEHEHEHESPSSAKRAKTKARGSPASSVDYHEYMILSSSPTETTSGGGASASASALAPAPAPARPGRPSSSRPAPQRASTALAPTDEQGRARTATAKRKKSSASTSEAGRARAKGKMRAQSPEALAPAPAPAGPSTSGSRTTRRHLTEEELAHISAFSGDVLPPPARPFPDPTPSYHSATQVPTRQQYAVPRHQHEPAIEPQLLHAPTPAAPVAPQRTGTLDVQGERDPPPPYEEATASSSRPSRARGRGKGKAKAASKSKSKDSKSEQSSYEETDSEYANSETELLDRKKGGRRPESGTQGGEPGEPRPTVVFVPGARPPVRKDEKRRGRVKIDVACEFCRKRKMRCDGRRPHCMNCITKERTDECVYVNVVRRRGPGKKPKGGRKIVKPKAIRELEEEQRRKDEAEARRIEAIRAAERETLDALWNQAHAEVDSILARQQQQQQDHNAPSGSANPPLFAPPETIGGGRLGLFPGMSPLSTPVLPGGGGGDSLSPAGTLSGLRLPFDSELHMSIPVPEGLMDVRMASPPPPPPLPPALSPPFAPYAFPPTGAADMGLRIDAAAEREELQPLLAASGETSRQGPRRGTLASAPDSRSSTRRAREGGAGGAVGGMEDGAGPWAQSTPAPHPSFSFSFSSSSSSSSRAPQTATAPGGRAVSASMPTRERPSSPGSSALGRSASVRAHAQTGPSASASASASAERRTARGAAPLRTIPTPAQLLSATTTTTAAAASVGGAPSDLPHFASGSGSGSVPLFAPEQVEAFARRALGAQPPPPGAEAGSAGAAVGQRRARADAFGEYGEEGAYGSDDAREGDPVSGERPSKRAREERSGRGRAQAEGGLQAPASEVAAAAPASGSGARAVVGRLGWSVRASSASPSRSSSSSFSSPRAREEGGGDAGLEEGEIPEPRAAPDARMQR